MVAALFIVSCANEDAGRQAREKFEYEKQYKRGPLELAVKLSKKEITIADRLTLVTEAVIKEDYEFEFPAFGEKLEQFGIVDYTNKPVKLVDDGKMLLQRSYVLEPFLSGEYRIPPMEFRFRKKDMKEEKHEFETEEIVVKVKSLLPEKQAELTIKDIAGPVELPCKTGRWIYYTAAGACLLVVFVAALLLICRKKKADATHMMVSAHEIAYSELEKLLSEDLIEKGEVKLFYIRLTGTMRRYIENRFGLRAPEQTTEEFLVELRGNSFFNPEHKALLKEFLNHCDLVKFAAFEPTKEDIQKTFDATKEFIEATKAEDKQVSVPISV